LLSFILGKSSVEIRAFIFATMASPVAIKSSVSLSFSTRRLTMTYSFKQSINLTLPILLVLLLGTSTQATASIDTTALVGSTAGGLGFDVI
jgi:hypothetical protein